MTIIVSLVCLALLVFAGYCIAASRDLARRNAAPAPAAVVIRDPFADHPMTCRCYHHR